MCSVTERKAALVSLQVSLYQDTKLCFLKEASLSLACLVLVLLCIGMQLISPVVQCVLQQGGTLVARS